MLEMKNISGCIRPLANWALNPASYSASFCSAKSRADSSCRPKTFTRVCPVYISSIWALSVPVTRHCRTNCGCDRLPTCVATTTDSGTVTSATSASSGEIQNIITSTPTIVSTELMSWPIVCWSVCEMLSMSFVARLSTSPRLARSKYDSGSRASFVWRSSRSWNTIRLITRIDTRVATSISSPAPT
ncbi:hypothetical protein SCALM49S_08556 [Streptomyces californicus]